MGEATRVAEGAGKDISQDHWQVHTSLAGTATLLADTTQEDVPFARTFITSGWQQSSHHWVRGWAFDLNAKPDTTLLSGGSQAWGPGLWMGQGGGGEGSERCGWRGEAPGCIASRRSACQSGSERGCAREHVWVAVCVNAWGQSLCVCVYGVPVRRFCMCLPRPCTSEAWAWLWDLCSVCVCGSLSLYAGCVVFHA